MSINYKIAHNAISCSLRLTRVAQFIVFSFVSVQIAFADTDDVQFNSDFLRSAIDVSNYSREPREETSDILSFLFLSFFVYSSF